MPEARESEASFLITGAAMTDVITSGVHLHLECIEIDATTKEANLFKKDPPARAALPYTIDTICTVSMACTKLRVQFIHQCGILQVGFQPVTVFDRSMEGTGGRPSGSLSQCQDRMGTGWVDSLMGYPFQFDGFDMSTLLDGNLHQI
jgi:hypothetical protein